jgi:hypothetical protein
MCQKNYKKKTYPLQIQACTVPSKEVTENSSTAATLLSARARRESFAQVGLFF